MARTWLQVKVELDGGQGADLRPRPGRVFMVGPGHTFASLATAINAAFARWDLGHLHFFKLSDGRRIGTEFFDSEDLGWLPESELKAARELKPGDGFEFTFDLGDDWLHLCEVLPDKIDPIERWGDRPRVPVAIWGWGSIPDQYGRVGPDG